MKRVALLASLGGCASITTHSVIHDQELRRTADRIGDPSWKVAGELESSADHLGVTVVERASCVERPVHHVHRTEELQRSVSKPALIAEYVLGIGALGFGGAAVGAPDQVQVSTTAAITIGVAGVPFLIAAIVDSVRAGDEMRDRGEVAIPEQGHDATVACGERPKAQVALVLRTGEAHDVVIGTTGADGRAAIAWSAVPVELVAGATWVHTAQLVAGDVTLGQVDLAPARRSAADAAWAELGKQPSQAGLDAYAIRFGDAHVADATVRRSQLLANQYATAIAAGDPEAARTALVAWRTSAPDDQGHAAREAEVAQLAARVATTRGLTSVTTTLDALEAGTAVGTPVATTEATLAQLASDPGLEPQLEPLRKRLLAARVKQGPLLLVRADQELRAAQPDQARATFALALDVGVPQLGVVKLGAAFERRLAVAERSEIVLREKAAREAAAKEQLAARRAAQEEEAAERDRAENEHAERERAAKEQAAKDQAAKDQAAKDQAAKDQAAKDQAAKDQAAKDQAAKDQVARDRAAKDQAAKDQAAADRAAKDQAAQDRTAKEQAAREQAERDRAAKQQAARDQSAAEKAAREAAAKAQADREQAAREQAAARKTAKDQAATETAAARDKAAVDQGAHAKAPAASPSKPADAVAFVVPQSPAGETNPAAFRSGYTDEAQCAPSRYAADDPYSARPALGIETAIGFGGGYASGLSGLMVGEAGVRYRIARAFGALSGGAGLQTLDLAAGVDAGQGYESYSGLAFRGGYARGFAIRGNNDFNELRADAGLANLNGASWLGMRLRVNDGFGFDSFFILLMLDRIR